MFATIKKNETKAEARKFINFMFDIELNYEFNLDISANFEGNTKTETTYCPNLQERGQYAFK